MELAPIGVERLPAWREPRLEDFVFYRVGGGV